METSDEPVRSEVRAYSLVGHEDEPGVVFLVLNLVHHGEDHEQCEESEIGIPLFLEDRNVRGLARTLYALVAEWEATHDVGPDA